MAHETTRNLAVALLQWWAPLSPTRRQFNRAMLLLLCDDLRRSLLSVGGRKAVVGKFPPPDLNMLLTNMEIDGDLWIDNSGDEQRIHLRCMTLDVAESTALAISDVVKIISAG